MDSNIWGAIIGSLLAGVISYGIASRQIKKSEEMRRDEYQKDILLQIIDLVAEIRSVRNLIASKKGKEELDDSILKKTYELDRKIEYRLNRLGIQKAERYTNNIRESNLIDNFIFDKWKELNKDKKPNKVFLFCKKLWRKKM